MRIGFIGAGFVAFSLSKYLNDKYHNVVGIYSKDIKDAMELSSFSYVECYSKLVDLIYDCDALFLTVNDDEIKNVVNELIKLKVNNKILIHTSGSKSSLEFNELNDNNYCYSLHPIYAFNSKYESYKNLDKVYFTLEGNEKYTDDIKALFPDHVKVIDRNEKAKYHLGCVFISNLVCGLINEGLDIFKSIGIDDLSIFNPLIENNINNILNKGPVDALTGPVVRNDYDTIKAHLENVIDKDKKIYIYLSYILINMAKNKKNNDYEKLIKLLEDNDGNC